MPHHHDRRMARGVSVRVGDEIPVFERRITREMAEIHGAPMRNFHTVLEDAKALGFPDLVIAGPMFTCFYSEMLTRAFGGVALCRRFIYYRSVLVYSIDILRESGGDPRKIVHGHFFRHSSG